MTSLKLSLITAADAKVDLAVTAPSGVTVGALATALSDRDPVRSRRMSDPLTLTVHGEDGPRPLDPNDEVGEAGLGCGVTVSLRAASSYGGGAGSLKQVGTLTVLEGPDRGRTFALHSGSNLVGRDPSCTVSLSDKQVSKLHAVVHIGATVEIRDVNSTNGVRFGGGLVSRAVVRPEDRVELGENTVVSISASVQRVEARVAVSPQATQLFNRSPRLDPEYEGIELEAPTPPKRAARRRFPLIPMLTPLIMGSALFLLTRSPFSLIFIFMSPMMVGGAYAEDLVSRRREFKAALADFRAALQGLDRDLRKAMGEEHLQRCASHPSTLEMVTSAHAYGPLLWTRRPEHRSFLELRTGLATLPSRNRIKMPSRGESPQNVWDELKEAVAPYSTVDLVPVVGALRECGAIGVAGREDAARRVARGLIAQLVTLHSPAEVVLCAIMSTAASAQWAWLKWLPHTSPYPLSAHTPLRSEQLSTGGASASALLAELDDLIRLRSTSKSVFPVVVLLVSDDTDADRGRLVDLAERGPEVGVHVIWVAASIVRLPAVCRTFIEVVNEGSAGDVGFVRTGDHVERVRLEALSGKQAEALAMRLSPVVDAGARLADESDLPRMASFVALEGSQVDRQPQAVIDRWVETQSGLRALVGAVGANEVCHLDLVTQGPHALLGGTTGAGKSELLQTWLLGMAVAHDPRRVNFLLVDYKGGSAFGAIDKLPHSVGMVTDLDPHRVRRVLTSLRAELTRRERIVERCKAKDLSDLERHHLDQAPARLVIVVDEFAALKTEIPEFVDGMVDIAQRGRSLGLHLILATQRPTGVINDQLKANTNLRIALRMADAGDSNDVLGTPQAASFDLDIPGRAAARTGPGRITTFQAAYAGGWTDADTAGKAVVIRPMPFGRDEPWLADYATSDHSDTDIARIVKTVIEADHLLRLPPRFVPWLPELPTELDLPGMSTMDPAGLVFGLRDLPKEQSQPRAVFDLDAGNLLVYGSGGSGKSTLLRTLAVAAARGDAGACHVYGIDFGNRGLDVLEALPQVAPIVRGDDNERLTRLLDRLELVIQERAARFSPVQANSITAYWRRMSTSDHWAMPRILLLVDGAGSFYQAYPPGTTSGLYEKLVAVATRGRPVGVHLAMTTDRPNAVPGSLSGTAQTRVVLRMASEGDYNLIGIRSSDALAPDAPPGRGLLDRAELQVAVAGGGDIETELTAIKELAERTSHLPPAPAIEVMPTEISLSELRSTSDDPLLGIAYETLEPVGFTPKGFFIITGQAKSGRTTTLRTIVAALRRWRPEMPLVLLSPLPHAEVIESANWLDSATSGEAVLRLAESLASKLRGAPPHAVLVESFPDLTEPRDPQSRLENLLKVCRDNGHFVVVEGDSTRMMKAESIYTLIRSRNGVGLQIAPTMQFSTILGFEQAKQPRLASPPAGRGILVTHGQPRIVQIALPS